MVGHSERSEKPPLLLDEILRCAQDDNHTLPPGGLSRSDCLAIGRIDATMFDE